jgi:hypothetical protein
MRARLSVSTLLAVAGEPTITSAWGRHDSNARSIRSSCASS